MTYSTSLIKLKVNQKASSDYNCFNTKKRSCVSHFRTYFAVCFHYLMDSEKLIQRDSLYCSTKGYS